MRINGGAVRAIIAARRMLERRTKIQVSTSSTPTNAATEEANLKSSVAPEKSPPGAVTGRSILRLVSPSGAL